MLWLFTVLARASVIVLAIWRLEFHPLKSFPGPKLAACMPWYECALELLCRNRIRRLSKLHQEYGNVVRVGPNHLHINDPNIYEEALQRPRLHREAPHFYPLSNKPEITRGAIEHSKYQAYRAAVHPRPFRTSLDTILPLVNEVFQEAANQTRQQTVRGEFVDVRRIHSYLTVRFWPLVLWQYLPNGSLQPP